MLDSGFLRQGLRWADWEAPKGKRKEHKYKLSVTREPPLKVHVEGCGPLYD